MEIIRHRKQIPECEFSEMAEYLAKKYCEWQGIDPNFETTGLGILAPSSYKYPLWKAWAQDVDFIINEYFEYQNKKDIEIREKYDDGMNDYE